MVEGQARMVLLVEDDNSMRAALERLLNAFGFQCVAFESAEALLARDLIADAACVVSDLHLPGMSGLDLIAALRTREESLPVIAITAHDKPDLRQAAESRGAIAYLAKPFHGTLLVKAVQGAIEAAGSA